MYLLSVVASYSSVTLYWVFKPSVCSIRFSEEISIIVFISFHFYKVYITSIVFWKFYNGVNAVSYFYVNSNDHFSVICPSVIVSHLNVYICISRQTDKKNKFIVIKSTLEQTEELWCIYLNQQTRMHIWHAWSILFDFTPPVCICPYAIIILYSVFMYRTCLVSETFIL